MKPVSGVRLVPASLDSPAELESFLLDAAEGERGFSGSGFQSGDDLSRFLQSLVDMGAGRGLAAGLVPMTTFWLLNREGRVVGVSRLRHSLTPRLLVDGGHIGYYIAPRMRGHGLGIEILRLTIEAAHSMGISPLLLTVDSDNLASIRVIESNGGRLEDERLAAAGEPYRRYWI